MSGRLSPTRSPTAISRPRPMADRSPFRNASPTSLPGSATAIRSAGRSDDLAMSCSPACARSSARSDLDALADLQLGEPAHVEQLGHVLFSAERGEHAREVTDGGDGRAEPLADVLPGGGAAQVLVAPGAGGL